MMPIPAYYSHQMNDQAENELQQLSVNNILFLLSITIHHQSYNVHMYV